MGPEAAYVLALILRASPVDQVWPMPGWSETADARRLRYASIAEDIAAVVWDKNRTPLFAGTDARKRTAALIVSIGRYESNFDKDVDIGPCYRGAKGATKTRCDSGRSACILQIWTGSAEGTTAEGWTQKEVFADRRKCITSGMNALQKSFTTCTAEGTQINLYASGSCASGHAVTGSRMFYAKKLFDEEKADSERAVARVSYHPGDL